MNNIHEIKAAIRDLQDRVTALEQRRNPEQPALLAPKVLATSAKSTKQSERMKAIWAKRKAEKESHD